MSIKTQYIPVLWKQFRRFFSLALCSMMAVESWAEPVSRPQLTNETLTKIADVRQFVSSQKTARCSVRLEGIVLWVSASKDQLIIQDDSGGMPVKVDLHNQHEISTGSEVLIEGSCTANQDGIAFGLLIDNDGIHSSSDKSGTIFLSAGLHPISVEWFNGPSAFDLELSCMGSQMPRQKVPEAALFRLVAGDGGTNRLLPGLNYRCYEGSWNRLPDFSQLPIQKQGTVSNFDLQVRTRDSDVGIVFSGYFKVPKDGEYSFWLKSDDGSKLYINDQSMRLVLSGKTNLPIPSPIFPGRLIPADKEWQWSEVEGIVTHVNDVYGGFLIELTSDTGQAYLKVMDGGGDYAKMLLHCRIKAIGVSQNTSDIYGQTMPSLLIPNLANIAILEMFPTHWDDCPMVPIQSITQANTIGIMRGIVHVSGIVSSNSAGELPVIEDGTGQILLETAQKIPQVGEQVEAVGRWSSEGSNIVLRGGYYRGVQKAVSINSNGLPLLTKVIQIKSLSRNEAQRGYPVKIQGVITAKVGADFVIEDSSASIFVEWSGAVMGESPKIGEFWEIEGESLIDFAPNIKVHRAAYLRPGILPEPLHPAIAELINGSLDTRYVELQGIVTAAQENQLTLLTREGRIKLFLHSQEPMMMTSLENARVRIRGVNTLDRDDARRMSAPLLLYNASVSIDEAAPNLPFEAPLKRAADLLFFDARADAFRRIKVAGQILQERNGEFFLTDGTNGLRFEPKVQTSLNSGDQVEVVGFPDISGTSPTLREAEVRLTGKAELPPAKRLSESNLLSGKLDATRVCLNSRLIGLSADQADQILELKAGTQIYVARLAKSWELSADILPESLLELTGIYAGHGGDRASGREIDSFELLLNSPADIRVLARPSWWTFRHSMTVLGGMLLFICIAVVWITLLRSQVKERTLQLTSEIKGREQAEYHRALEEERTRIASDLHDELGATLTEIRFLGAVGSRDLSVPQATRIQLTKVSQRSHQMVSSLDEIVWAINPKNDYLPNLVNYLCHSAEEFFHATTVRCRLDVGESLPQIALISEVRHNLFLVVREALNNVAKHSQATEVWLRIYCESQTLHINIEDNGRGFELSKAVLGNGQINMRRRLEKIGGRFEIETRPNSGTACRISLPFA